MQAKTDRRAQHSRQALLGALIELVLTRSYEEISVADIAARAGVGRSTLYEHFRGKDAILATSLAYPFGTLADAVLPADNTQALIGLLEHFWHNRALGRELFSGPLRRHAVAVLVRLVQERLRSRRGTWLVPPRLAAIQIAEALLAPVIAWVLSAPVCPAPRLARALRESAVALTAALCATPRQPRRPKV